MIKKDNPNTKSIVRNVALSTILIGWGLYEVSKRMLRLLSDAHTLQYNSDAHILQYNNGEQRAYKTAQKSLMKVAKRNNIEIVR